MSISPDHLKQVLINLINNAADAMPCGGDLIIKSSIRGKGIEILVEDSGTGIEEESLREIFRPFFTTKGVKGTGLGLSITYGIIQNYNGEIHLQNKKEGGVMANIYLPCQERGTVENG